MLPSERDPLLPRPDRPDGPVDGLQEMAGLESGIVPDHDLAALFGGAPPTDVPADAPDEGANARERNRATTSRNVADLRLLQTRQTFVVLLVVLPLLLFVCMVVGCYYYFYAWLVVFWYHGAECDQPLLDWLLGHLLLEIIVLCREQVVRSMCCWNSMGDTIYQAKWTDLQLALGASTDGTLVSDLPVQSTSTVCWPRPTVLPEGTRLDRAAFLRMNGLSLDQTGPEAPLLPVAGPSRPVKITVERLVVPQRVRVAKAWVFTLTPLWLLYGVYLYHHAGGCAQTAPEVYNFVYIFLAVQVCTWLTKTVLFLAVFMVAMWFIEHGLVRSNRAAGKGLAERLETVPFSSKVFSDDEDAVAPPECSICQEDYDASSTICVTPCRHYFHSACLGEWFERDRVCPLCRHDVEASVNAPA